MSVKVAVVCEDPTHDQFIARPIIDAALAAIGKPRARVQIVTDPKTSSDADVISRVCEILERYAPVADAVVFLVDADCEDGTPGRRDKKRRLTNAIERCASSRKAIAIAALQELEVWALWGVRAKLRDEWAVVRTECHPKELYFEPSLTPADYLRADGGRARLVAASLKAGWPSLRTGCNELAELEAELSKLVQ